MQPIALHTRLKPGMESEYETVHEVIPAELDGALRAAGVHSWRIWRDGRRPCLRSAGASPVVAGLRMRDELRDHPANVPWQARMARLLEVEDDCSGTDSGLQP